MKITNTILQKIIKEEVEKIVQEIEDSDLDEGVIDRTIGRVKGGIEQAKGAAIGGLQRAGGAALSKVGAGKAGAELAQAGARRQRGAKYHAQSEKLIAAIKPKFDEMVNDLTKLGFEVDKEKAMQVMIAMSHTVQGRE